MIVDFHGLTYDQFEDGVTDKETGNIFPYGITDSLALQILFDHFLPSDYTITYSCGKHQANSEMVGEILRKYPAGKIKKIPKYKSSDTDFQKVFEENRL